MKYAFNAALHTFQLIVRYLPRPQLVSLISRTYFTLDRHLCNTADALVSLTFNLGARALQRSIRRRKVNGGEHESVPSELMKWVIDWERLPGLVHRRKAETLASFSESPVNAGMRKDNGKSMQKR